MILYTRDAPFICCVVLTEVPQQQEGAVVTLLQDSYPFSVEQLESRLSGRHLSAQGRISSGIIEAFHVKK